MDERARPNLRKVCFWEKNKNVELMEEVEKIDSIVNFYMTQKPQKLVEDEFILEKLATEFHKVLEKQSIFNNSLSRSEDESLFLKQQMNRLKLLQVSW